MGLEWEAALKKKKNPQTPRTLCCNVTNKHNQYTQLFPKTCPKKVLKNVAIEKSSSENRKNRKKKKKKNKITLLRTIGSRDIVSVPSKLHDSAADILPFLYNRYLSPFIFKNL